MAKWFKGGESPPVVAVGDAVEIQVYDDAGNEQGTVLIGVRKLLREHHGGQLIEATFSVASVTYYHGVDERRISCSVLQGYHLCAVAAQDCPVAKKHGPVVHSATVAGVTARQS